ncbi:hypothetical protein C8F01DRAFT_1265434 [Mycena amicta]|nr:hypothetical protein C8F01DRAFT_1265434 [Mycena amicta]
MDDGITQSYWSVFELVMVRVIDVFQLTAIVLQYGAVSETSCAIGLENDVSEERSWCEYFERLGPRYRLELEVVKSNMEDLTLRDGGLNCLRERTLEQLQELSLHLALCVEMQDVPGETLRRIWAPASRRNAWLAMNGLDETLAQHTSDVYDLHGQAERHGNGSDDSDESANEDEDNDCGYSSDEASTAHEESA